MKDMRQCKCGNTARHNMETCTRCGDAIEGINITPGTLFWTLLIGGWLLLGASSCDQAEAMRQCQQTHSYSTCYHALNN